MLKLLERIKILLLSLAWSLGFGLWSAGNSQDLSVLIFGFCALLFISLLMLWVTPNGVNKSLWQLAGTAITLVGWFGVFTLLPLPHFRVVFLLLTFPFGIFLFSTQFSVSEYVISNRMLVGSFLVCISLAGVSQYFKISAAWLLLTGCILFVGLIRSALSSFPHSALQKMMSSLVFTLAWVELFWVLSFLPIHYTALGFILWITFYTAWVLYSHFLFHTLTVRKLQFYISLGVLLLAVVLFATPWHVL